MRVEKPVAISLAVSFVILCGAPSGLHASAADPQPPKPGAAVRPPPRPPLPGIYSATYTSEAPDAHGNIRGTERRASCGQGSGRYVYYYPGPGKPGALMIGNEGIMGNGPVTYVGWDPYFSNPANGGVTPLRADLTNGPEDPEAHFGAAYLPGNNADPEKFRNRIGYRAGDIATTFDTSTHFTMTGIWGQDTLICRYTLDLVRIGCLGDHPVDLPVSLGSDGSSECQQYCHEFPDCKADRSTGVELTVVSGRVTITGCRCVDVAPSPPVPRTR